MQSYAPTTRNVDHTKYATSGAPIYSYPSLGRLISVLRANAIMIQVRRRTCDQYPKGDEYRGDSSETQACPKLHRLHMGPQVFWGLLGRHESVSTKFFFGKDWGDCCWIASKLSSAGYAGRLEAVGDKADMESLSQATHSGGRGTDLQGIDYGSQGSTGRPSFYSARGNGKS